MTRSNVKKYRDRDWLYKHYIILQESTYTMAREAECSDVTILRWLRKFNIPTRARGEAIFLANRNFLDFSDKLSDLLEGELLGDGFIGMNSSRSARYAHSSKHEEYLIWLSKTFASLGLEQIGKINERWHKKSKTFSYHYTSKSYPELVPLRKCWYPDGKKIVPKDLVLTPIMARQWYIGDGRLGDSAKKRPQISFSTCDFDKASINHLLKELGAKGFKVSHWPSSNKIGLSVYSVKDFLDYIGPCPKEIQNCYGYKWEV